VAVTAREKRLHTMEVQPMPKSRENNARKPAGQPARKTAQKSKPSKLQRPATKAASSRGTKLRSATTPARASKKAAIVNLLQRPNGAAIGDLIKATGWQAYSVRAALTGLRKDRKELARAKDAAGVTHYRFAANA
jgi:hypothetical protein